MESQSIKRFNFLDNTYEPLDNLVHCSVFREFVDAKYRKLETDIFVNLSNMRQHLKKRIRETYSSLPKAAIMFEVLPFDPFEFKVYQVFYHLLDPLSDAYKEKLKELAFKHVFFRREIMQRLQNDEFHRAIREKEQVEIRFENLEDFDEPPEFKYITKNYLTNDLYVVEHSTITGCKCKGGCSKETDCCPQLMKETFPYKIHKTNGRVLPRLNISKKIIECGDLCACGVSCINRLTQKKRSTPLCLFKTKDRGWGVKAIQAITVGTYIIEYVGELIGQNEANRRDSAYLFDLNHDNRQDNRFYTIDAFEYGNLSRFINHSCEANANIWFVNTCGGRPENQRICIFATKPIAKGEEITIDYCGGNERDKTDEDFIQCTCGSAKCRGYVY